MKNVKYNRFSDLPSVAHLELHPVEFNITFSLKEVEDCIRQIKWFRDKLHHDIGELQSLLDMFELILNHGKDE